MFAVYEFGTLVLSTNGYYRDMHKMAFADGMPATGFAATCILSLVCASLMREESGTRCISIKPSKTVGIYDRGL